MRQGLGVHYEPLQQDEAQYTPLLQNSNDVALVVVPPWSGVNDIFFHCTIMPFLKARLWKHSCHCESTAVIVQEFVDASDAPALADASSSTDVA